MRDKELVGALRRCLEDTETSIRSGNFDQLGDIAKAVEESVRNLMLGAPPPVSELQALRDRAERLMRCLEAAREGAESAVQRFEQIRRMASEFATYDRDGRGNTFQFPPIKLEHRA